ncbi:MAG: hypothetical protein J5601_05410 [Elusimicrobiaceae bacterium]|nr:hypothetical protein [Elusimicrobiaceae bacterium]
MDTQTIALQAVTKMIGLETIPSTQDLARSLVRSQEHATLVLACQQSNAFDRFGKPFPSTEGGVYFTLILKPGKEILLETLTRAFQNALTDTLEKVFELKTKLTTDGDVLVWDRNSHKYKKIAGILAEENENGNYLIGAGIFVNNKLPATFKNSCISLKTIIGSETSKELFLDDVLNNFWKEYAFL